MDSRQIGIVSWGSISSLGHSEGEIWGAYTNQHSAIEWSDPLNSLLCKLGEETEEEIEFIRKQKKPYKNLDRSVVLAIIAAQNAWKGSHWKKTARVGVNLGSSRGATESWENYHQKFLASSESLTEPMASPYTTLGNLATWTAHHLGIQGPTFSHSITCSTALQAFANAINWMEAKRCDRFIVGGTEAPLTPFTIAQMKALRIYALPNEPEYPCRAMDLEKKANSMVLGEGAACFCLENYPEKPLAWIIGLGTGSEPLETATAISKDGLSFQQSMESALEDAGYPEIDIILTHSPGTKLGDQSEYSAIRKVFGENIPAFTTNKWKIGHTLGASGALNAELALLMLQYQKFIPIPFLKDQKPPSSIQRLMINAVGFGGNAISMIIEKS